LEKDLGFCVVVLRWDSADQLYDSTRFTGWHTAYRDAAPRNQGYAVSAAAEF
jgi:glutamine synthetase